MKLTIALIINLLLINMTLAQEKKGFVNTSQTADNIESGNSLRTFDDRYSGIKGHPYMFEDAKKMWLITKKSDSLLISGNINLYAKELIMIRGEKVKGVIPLKQVSYFLIDNNRWQEHTVKGKSYVMTQIYRSPNIQILMSHEKILEKADYTGAYSSGQTQDEFKYKSTIWAYNFDETKAFKMKISGLSKIFNKPEKAIKKELKAKGLNINDESDYNAIFKLLDE
ncbi:hypothetical protein [Ekhidna sp.]